MVDSRGAMSRKGGWYDEADDYYDEDDDDYYDDDDEFGAYDTGSLAPKKSGASGGGKPPGGAGGKKPGGVAAAKAPRVPTKRRGGGPGAPPVAPGASAMARTVSVTPKEKGVARPDVVAAAFPAAPPNGSRGGFGFDAPSPDDAVLAKRRVDGPGKGVHARAVPAIENQPRDPETRASDDGEASPSFSNASVASDAYAAFAPPPERLPLVPRKKRLHLVVLGHVDAGKSTLFGRVMHALGATSDRERHRNARDARAAGKASFAWAWALDARPEERARGVTVDVAKVCLDTGSTLVHLLDAPGHRDFVPNAIAGAAQADAACLVVDASRGAFESGFRAGGDDGAAAGGGQTREHVRLARSLGVERLIVAVSKMDSCAYSQARFEEIKGALAPFLRKSGFAEDAVAWTPVSGTDGTNLVPETRVSLMESQTTNDDADADDDERRGKNAREARDAAIASFRSWYPETDARNLCLVAAMDAIPEPDRGRPMPLRFPASELVGAGDRFLGPCAVGGKVEAGSVRAGDTVAVVPEGIIATVKAVRVVSHVSGGGGVAGERDLTDARDQVAFAGDAADVGLDLPDASRLAPGTVLCDASFPLVPAARFTVKLVTLDALRVPLLVGSSVVVHAYASSTEARVTKLVSSLDKKTGDVLRTRPRCVSRDAAAVVELAPSRALAVERFEDYPKLGRVQLRRDGATVALGVVVETFAH